MQASSSADDLTTSWSQLTHWRRRSRRISLKYQINRLLLRFWKQMPIPSPLLVSLVPDPLIDKSLVNPLGNAVAYETVTKQVPARNDRPLATGQCRFQVVTGFVWSNGTDQFLGFSSANTTMIFWKQEWTCRLGSQPTTKHLFHRLSKRNGSGCAFRTRPLSFPDCETAGFPIAV